MKGFKGSRKDQALINYKVGETYGVEGGPHIYGFFTSITELLCFCPKDFSEFDVVEIESLGQHSHDGKDFYLADKIEVKRIIPPEEYGVGLDEKLKGLIGKSVCVISKNKNSIMQVNGNLDNTGSDFIVLSHGLAMFNLESVEGIVNDREIVLKQVYP